MMPIGDKITIEAQMSNRASKPTKSKKPQKKAQKTTMRISPWALILGLATLIGGVAALATLLPRVTVAISDPPDADDPFSSAVTVTNNGYLPLDSVMPSIGLGHIAAIGSPNEAEDPDPPYLPRFRQSQWRPHDMGLDDKFTFALNEVMGTNPGQLRSANIAIRVEYEVPLIHWKREKVFPMFAHRQANGRFYWYAKAAN
jgi:hypothetical protein